LQAGAVKNKNERRKNMDSGKLKDDFKMYTDAANDLLWNKGDPEAIARVEEKKQRVGMALNSVPKAITKKRVTFVR